MTLKRPPGPCEGSAPQEDRGLGFWPGFALVQTLGLFFLTLDGFRRASDELYALGAVGWLINIGVVGSVLSGLSAGLALGLWGLDQLASRLWAGYRRQLSLGLLYGAFFSVNLLFLKFRLIEPYGQLTPRGQTLVTAAAALSMVLAWRPLRDRLRAVAAAYEAGGRRLAVWLTLPFGVLLIAGAAIRTNSSPALQAAQAGPVRPHIVLVTFDSLAAQDMSLYGCPLPTTPGLSALQDEFAVFQRCHAGSNMTETALCNFQGFYFAALRPEHQLLRLLEQAGYQDSLWVSFHQPQFFRLPRPQLTSIVHGFEDHTLYRLLGRIYEHADLQWLASLGTEEAVYFNPYNPEILDEYHRFWRREHHPAAVAFERAFHHLSTPRAAPTFTWVHLWPPHYPYLPGPRFRGRFGSTPLPSPPLNNAAYSPATRPLVDGVRRAYAEYILECDSLLCDFVSRLREAGLLDRTLLIVSADHGECFSRGFIGHSGELLYEPLIHIPLLIRFPGGQHAGRVQTLAAPVDLAPTVLDFLDLPVPPTLQGESLLPYLREPDRLSQTPRYSVSSYAYTTGKGEAAVLCDRYKVVFRREDRNRIRMYDLFADPHETRDLAPEQPERARKLAGYLLW